MRLVTTHDWAWPVDVDHLASVRADVERFAAGGVVHLVLEVLAYAVDEASEGTTTRIDVVLHRDGSFEVRDNGRGTDTRVDDRGVAVVKPIMATADLRFHGIDDAPLLADGLPRRGMSVVAALSSVVEHTNRRASGAWTARYERGIPVGAPARIVAERGASGHPTGTSVRAFPDPDVCCDDRLDVGVLRSMVGSVDTSAVVTVNEC